MSGLLQNVNKCQYTDISIFSGMKPPARFLEKIVRLTNKNAGDNLRAILLHMYSKTSNLRTSAKVRLWGGVA